MSVHEGKLIDLAASCRFDPWQWGGVAFDWGYGALKKFTGPRVWQDETLQDITDHLQDPEKRYTPLQIAVASGHGIGKSALMGILSTWAMSCFKNARVVTTANTMGQLRTKTAPEVSKWFQLCATAQWFDVQSQAVKVNETWRDDFSSWSEHNTEAFAGLHNYGSIILILYDEASKIADKVWEVTEGVLTDEDTIIIWIAFGNPTQNSGRFRECFRKFRHRWITKHIDSREVEGINKATVDRLVEDYGEDHDVVKVRVRGQFPSSSLKQFIGTPDVDAARQRHLHKRQYDFAPVVIGVDPAWTGEDSLEIYLRQGLYSKHLLTIPYNDDDVAVANIIANFETQYKADAVFVDMGYGTGIVSVGKALGRSWQLIAFAGKSARVDCLNKRMEMWYNMRQWLKEGGAIDPKDDVLYEDMIGPETISRHDGIYQLESKQNMKDRGQPSPNKGDALALTFALPVVSRDERLREGVDEQTQAEVEYDPLAEMA